MLHDFNSLPMPRKNKLHTDILKFFHLTPKHIYI